ncbi:MAG: hypothetical protein A2Z99_02430 [Treponema sp. GWB1_62_6]|nr:MAG: hypothetical protein A2Z99_02430 [Treponema sp. GWB1_62_6]OHE69493.1 MAG: hypothetical protein A2001_19970 [Treponema sp. GWC1_61_84]OHE72484.1 MAG: hypothetical protein A2413_14080 [Treponema sp. RIFOXYC1_FULL_61_9]
MIERYGVYWVTLDPVVGKGIAKTRPAVVISDDAMNRILGIVVVCPITSRLHPRRPSRAQAVINGQPSEIAIDQIRTLDKARIGEKLNQLDAVAPRSRGAIQPIPIGKRSAATHAVAPRSRGAIQPIPIGKRSAATHAGTAAGIRHLVTVMYGVLSVDS